MKKLDQIAEIEEKVEINNVLSYLNIFQEINSIFK